MFCLVRKVFCYVVVVVCTGLASMAYAQQITVVPLSTAASNSNYAASPQLDGVTFVADAEDENDFLVVIDGDIASASRLTVGPNGSSVIPGSVGPFSLSTPIIKVRDDEYSVSFVAIPNAIKGTAAENTATQTWATANTAWSTARFGWGWQESLGEWLAVNVLIPVVGVENLANASDTTLVTGTVIVSIPIAVGIVAGGEVVLGVGTLGGAAGGGTVATGTGVSVATSVANGTVQAGGTLEAVLVAVEAQGAGTSIATSLGNIGTAVGTVGLEVGVLEGGAATATAIANGTATQVVLTQAGGVTTTILASGEIIITRAGTVILHLIP